MANKYKAGTYEKKIVQLGIFLNFIPTYHGE